MTAKFTPDELTQAKRQIDSILHKLQEAIKTLEKKENSGRCRSQLTLAGRRIKALEIANSLIEERQNKQSKVKTAMWKCPKCGRVFKKQEQQHYCGEKPKTMDEYIMSRDEDKRGDLQTIRSILAASLPDAEERISWSMPTFWQDHAIVQFAASKKHIGFYPGAEAVAHFADRLSKYSFDKGTIRIPYGVIDRDLIKEIAKWCLENGCHT